MIFCRLNELSYICFYQIFFTIIPHSKYLLTVTLYVLFLLALTDVYFDVTLIWCRQVFLRYQINKFEVINWGNFLWILFLASQYLKTHWPFNIYIEFNYKNRLLYITMYHMIFISPELKAQTSFSDHFLSRVCLFVNFLHVRLVLQNH